MRDLQEGTGGGCKIPSKKRVEVSVKLVPDSSKAGLDGCALPLQKACLLGMAKIIRKVMVTYRGRKATVTSE